MDKNSKKRNLRIKRHKRIKAKIKGSLNIPRISFYRSNKGIFAQVIDDYSSTTLMSVNSLKEEKNINEIKEDNVLKYSGKVLQSYKSGLFLGGKMIKKNINKAIFDRGGFKFHGRVRAFAEGLKKAGIKV